MQKRAEYGSGALIKEENTSDSAEISATGLPRERTDRRHFTLKTIVYGFINPRRRKPRRVEDKDSYHADFFDRALLYPAVGTVLLSAMDAMLTLISIGNGQAAEVNSLMASLIESGSASFAAWKLIGTIVGVVILMSMANMRVLAGLRAKSILYILFGGYVLLVSYQLLKILTV